MTKNSRGYLALAVLLATVGSPQAQAGMSGTSARVEQQINAEARAVASPPAPAGPATQPPMTRAPVPQDPTARPSVGSFDGVWAVSASPGCGLLARSAVEVTRGRIVGQGLSGSVDADGNVRTVGYGGGLSVISKGRTGPAFGAGTYRVSNGCTGTWTSRKV